MAADPADYQARYDLATALNATDKRDEAADALLEIIRRNRAWNEDAARLQLLKFFEAWGFDDPATMAARRKLSALLFSLMARFHPGRRICRRSSRSFRCGRAAAAARQTAAEHLRAALPGDDRGRAWRPAACSA